MHNNFTLKTIFENLNNDYQSQDLHSLAKNFHTHFKEMDINDTKYSRYISILFFDFFEPEEFKKISGVALAENANANLLFGCFLFRLSLELTTDKTNHEKSMMFSFVHQLLGKHTKVFNDPIHYCLGFVATQASTIGVDISSSISIMKKIEDKKAPYFEEGFIDGLSCDFPHLLANDKLFKLYCSKYDNWKNESKQLLKKMYADFIPHTKQSKAFNPVNSNSFFWMKQYFTNESLVEYIDNYSAQAFTSTSPVANSSNVEIEKQFFTLQQENKQKDKDIVKLNNFISIFAEQFEGLKQIDPLQDISLRIVSQILSNQKDYIQSLEQYKIDNERTKQLKSGFKKVL